MWEYAAAVDGDACIYAQYLRASYPILELPSIMPVERGVVEASNASVTGYRTAISWVLMIGQISVHKCSTGGM